jgi:hypothetical protein
MLTRLVIIIMCVSLIGVTIVPASSIPCCCKSGHTNFQAQSRIPHPATEAVHACCSPGPAKVRSCCATKVVQATCAKGTVRGECPRCRCLEQLQIIALSGYSALGTIIRIPVLNVVATAPLGGIISPGMAALAPEADCRDIVVGLQTCTLRC